MITSTVIVTSVNFSCISACCCIRRWNCADRPSGLTRHDDLQRLELGTMYLTRNSLIVILCEPHFVLSNCVGWGCPNPCQWNSSNLQFNQSSSMLSSNAIPTMHQATHQIASCQAFHVPNRRRSLHLRFRVFRNIGQLHLQ